MLWAWERPEDLHFIDPSLTGIAYLARTLRVDPVGRVTIRERMQPLKVPRDTTVIAVVRIEVAAAAQPAILMAARPELVRAISSLADKHPFAIQVDYDARRSERDFYRALLVDIRKALPPAMPLSITALASWCVGDRWIDDLPVDEAVPMFFAMGPDGRFITSHLRSGGRLSRRCAGSIGLSLDEPLNLSADFQRRYIFRRGSWTRDALARAQREFEDIP